MRPEAVFRLYARVILPAMFHVLVQNGKVLSYAGKDKIVPWWSFTKTVIAAAALVQVQNKLLSLDETDDQQLSTLRQLLRHQAGLPDYGQLPDYHAAVERGDAPWPDDEMLERVEANRLRYRPGSGWAYSNVGYFYVRRLIERSADEDFGSALRRLVLRPLGIEQVRLAGSQQDLSNVDMGQMAAYDPRWVYHGLLVGPLADAAFLLDRLMAGCLLPKNLLTALLDAHPVGGPIAGRPWQSHGYGLGIMAGEVEDGLSVAGHTGGGPGSCIAVYRETASIASSCCATFSSGSDVGGIEHEAMRRLRNAVASIGFNSPG
jgi:CubicO group peptidase (beta-lactamase class C family)